MAQQMFESIDAWTPEQCQDALNRYNGESLHLKPIQENLEHYRERCRYVVGDYIGLNENARS
jgi:hypothetical protein